MLGERSRRELSTCHPRLQELIEEVDRRLSVRKRLDLTVLCGYRGELAQNQAYRDGNSKLRWPDSKHNTLPSRAVDVAPYPIDWKDPEMFMLLAGYILAVADEMGIDIEIGGLWKWRDRPHIQLGPSEPANDNDARSLTG